MAYGSLSTIVEVQAARTWAADWDDIPKLPPGAEMVGIQYTAAGAYDLSVCTDVVYQGGGIGPRK